MRVGRREYVILTINVFCIAATCISAGYAVYASIPLLICGEGLSWLAFPFYIIAFAITAPVIGIAQLISFRKQDLLVYMSVNLPMLFLILVVPMSQFGLTGPC